MIAAITPGTAYGAKNARRKNFPDERRVEQQREEQRQGQHDRHLHDAEDEDRPTEVQNASFWNTSTYCWNPPNTSVAAPHVPSRSTTSIDCQIATPMGMR